jgi:hypothetical protein
MQQLQVSCTSPAKLTLQDHEALQLVRRRFQKQVQLRHSGSCAGWSRLGQSWTGKLPWLLDAKQREEARRGLCFVVSTLGRTAAAGLLERDREKTPAGEYARVFLLTIFITTTQTNLSSRISSCNQVMLPSASQIHLTRTGAQLSDKRRDSSTRVVSLEQQTRRQGILLFHRHCILVLCWTNDDGMLRLQGNLIPLLGGDVGSLRTVV